MRLTHALKNLDCNFLRVMLYQHRVSRCTWLILLIAVVGLSISALARDFSAGGAVDPQSRALGHTFLIGPLAYVDPGSGQLIWQMIIAGCVGALFYVKRVRVFLGKLFSKWFKKKD